MKKTLWLFVTCLLSTVFVFGSLMPAYSKAEASEKGWPDPFIFVGMKGGGTATILGSALSKELKEKYGVNVQVIEGGGPAAMVNLVGRGEAQMNAISNHPQWEAFMGLGAFKKRSTNLRKILAVYPGAFHWMARADKNITKVADWKGYKAMYDWPSNTQQAMVGDALLEFHHLKKGVDVISLQGGSQEAFDAIKANLVQIILRLGPPGGHARIKQLATEIDLNFISFSDEELDYVINKVPSAVGPVIIPAGSYKGQKGEVRTMGYTFDAYSSSTVPESAVYQLCKVLFDSCGKDTPGHFQQYHKAFVWTLNSQMEHNLVIPWHDGAVKYFKERGVWTPWMEAKQKELLATIK